MERYFPLFLFKMENGMEWNGSRMEWNGTPFWRPMPPTHPPTTIKKLRNKYLEKPDKI